MSFDKWTFTTTKTAAAGHKAHISGDRIMLFARHPRDVLHKKDISLFDLAPHTLDAAADKVLDGLDDLYAELGRPVQFSSYRGTDPVARPEGAQIVIEAYCTIPLPRGRRPRRGESRKEPLPFFTDRGVYRRIKVIINQAFGGGTTFEK